MPNAKVRAEQYWTLMKTPTLRHTTAAFEHALAKLEIQVKETI